MLPESKAQRKLALRSSFILIFVVLGLTLAIWVAHAATRTWDGGSSVDGNWQTADNWQDNISPVAGDDLVFGASPRTTSNNNFIAGTTFNTITLGLGGNILSGNGVSLNAGLSMTGGIINLSSIKLNSAQTFSSVSGGGAINSAIDLNGNTLTIDGPGTIQFNGAVTGSAGVIKNGSGRMDLFGSTANTYIGQTKINDGLLQIAKSPGIPAVSSDLVIGDGVGAASSAVTRQFQNSQIPQQVTVNSDGLYDLNGFLEFISTLAVNGGNVTIGAGQLAPFDGVTMTGGTISSTGAGKLLLSNNLTAYPVIASISGSIDLDGGTRTFTVNNDNDNTTFDRLDVPAIVSNGSLTKAGAGVLWLRGNNLYTGTTTVFAGVLIIDGNQPQSAVQVNGGLLKSGVGTSGPVTVTAGRLADAGLCSSPSFNTFTVQGNLSLNSSAFYRATICGSIGIENSRLKITGNGTVSLGGSTLEINGGGPFEAGRTFVIIDNDGTDVVQGTFSGLPEGASLMVGNATLFISYKGGDGNDVTLHVTATRTWDGGSTADSNWTTKENWVGDVAPGIGDALVFQNFARATNTNDFPAGMSFNSITFLTSGYDIGGNSLALANGITGAGTINLPIKLAASQTFNSNFDAAYALRLNGSIDTNGKLLTLDGNRIQIDGVISGSGGLKKLGQDIHFLSANNTYTGPTTILGGQLTVAGNQAGSPVQISNAALAGEGTGTVKSITATGGTVIPLLTDLGNHHLDVIENTILDPASTYQASMSTTTQGLIAAHLDVGGTVNLGGSALVTQLLNYGSPTAQLGDTVVIIHAGGTTPIQGTFNGLPEGSVFSRGTTNFRISYVGGDGNDVTLSVVPAGGVSVQFSATNYSVNEGQASVNAVVTRVGDTSGAATVNYATSDGSGSNSCNVTNGAASSRCDYETSVGTLHFAGGEPSKVISVPVVNDSYAEGSETLALTLTSPAGASLGSPSIATVTIVDNETVDGTNPVDSANFFVRQHYLDFLNREPDSGGLAFWSDQITSCGADQACIDLRRINVSAAFFLSIEFQETGYLVERIYKAAYSDASCTSNFGPTHQLAVPVIRLNEFLADTQQIGKGVVVGQTGWEQVLENNKVAFTAEFVKRSRFATAFPTSGTPEQFVDALFANAGVIPTAAERTAAINEFSGAGTSVDSAARARALRRVAENPTLSQHETNRAFVLMQYFGYLRRNPNDAPDSDYTGYDFWLTKLNEFQGNFVSAEMVKAFIVSGEYKLRFGP
jgi:autotransporter-associated beta strand protein